MPEPRAEAAYAHNGAPVDAASFYALACDPRRHVAIEACAGAGKTWVLVSRIVRALLQEAESVPAGGELRPDAVLAITFTRQASAEMRARLVGWLREFAQHEPAKLADELRLRGLPESGITPARCELLKGLYARVLASGRPVQIRTFHGWFAALLRVAPLAVLQRLGLPTAYELLENDADAIEQVWRPFHQALLDDGAARADYQALVQDVGRSGARKALESALERRSEFERADRVGAAQGAIETAAQRHPVVAGLSHPALALTRPGVRERWLGWAAELGREKPKLAPKAADAIVKAWSAVGDGEAGAQALMEGLRKALFVKTAHRLNSQLADLPVAKAAETELQVLCLASDQHAAWLHQQRLVRLTRVLIAQYRALKRERGWVDMGDVEDAAQALLADPVVGAWVQQRLDQRIRHLLIDEFQDTNPAQWQALTAWLGSYAGAGASPPSLFFVGDPKQSIYRFRRAEPAVFRAAQAFLREGLGGELLSCDHTRRNAPVVLDAVNATFLQPELIASFSGFRAHTTASTESGAVGMLPPIPPPEKPAPPDPDMPLPWRDSLEQGLEEPEDGLRAAEARQAAAYLQARIAQGLSPQQVLVLARKRANLGPMRDALRDCGIAAQIGEDTLLAECAEVQDLIALMDVLASPGHDLSLARVLKSPLFGLDDTALVALAQRCRSPRTAWLDALRAPWPDAPADLRAAGERLRRWQPWVAALPPHDALQAIYDDGDVLAAYARALPPSARMAALDNLRALLSAALDLDGGRFASPYRLVRAFRAPGGVKAPAALQEQAVRLLTVHGAKGLEADVVLLLDTDRADPPAQTQTVLIDWPPGDPHPRRFMFLQSEASPPACAQDAMAAERGQRRREELNGLYVAMTRARRELVVSSIEPSRSTGSTWWKLLGPVLTPLPLTDAAPVGDGGDAEVAAPIRLRMLPPPESPVAGPAPVLASGDAAASDAADPELSRIGQAMHRLLQWSDLSDAAAQAAGREFALDAAGVARALAMARRIRQGQGAWVFEPQQLRWAGDEVEMLHAGRLIRLDRLVCRRDDGTWWVLDYKTASAPQQRPDLMAQLAQYREAVAAAWPGEPVRAAFLTGDGAWIEPEIEGPGPATFSPDP